MNFQDFKEWVLNNPSETNFMMNLKTIISNECTMKKYVPMIVAGVNAYIKAQAEIKITSDKPSEWLYSAGEKIVHIATLIGKNTFEGFYGMSHIYRFKDDSGNIIVWFSASQAEIQIGQKVEFKATIKTHDYFNSNKQTVVTRLKVIKEIL